MAAVLDHDSFPQPDTSICKVWRYLTLPRFASLVHDKALYFARADRLGDPFEGSLPHLNVVQRRQLVESGQFTEGAVREWEQLTALMPRWSYVSCWHRSEHESTAMWELYGGKGPSVALVTRYRDLAAALPGDVMLGEVAYVDYREDAIPNTNAFYPLMHKRVAYRHEREVRAILFRPPPGEPGDGVDLSKVSTPHGHRVGTDIRRLLRRVVLCPSASLQDLETVERLLASVDLSPLLERSALADEPHF